MRLWHVFLGLSALVFLVAICFVIRFVQPNEQLRISKSTTLLEGPLDENGSVDYLKAVNVYFSRGVVPENNAIAQLAKIVPFTDGLSPKLAAEFYSKLGVDPPDESLTCLDPFQGPVYDALESDEAQIEFELPFNFALEFPWDETAKEFSDVKQWLDENQTRLDKIVEASRCSNSYHPYVSENPNQPLLNSHLRSFQPVRHSIRGLRTRANQEFFKGNLEAALTDLAAVKRLAIHVSNGYSIRERFVGWMFLIHAEKNLTQAAVHVAAPVSNWKNATREYFEIGSISSDNDWYLNGESLIFFEALQASSLGRNELDTWSGKLGSADWNSAAEPIQRNREQIAKIFGTIDLLERDRLQRTFHEQLDELADSLQSQVLFVPTYSPKRKGEYYGQMIVSIMSPPLSVTYKASCGYQALTRTSRIAMQLSAFRHDHGHFPESLAELVPEYFAELPTDILGSPMRYHARENRFDLYGKDICQIDKSIENDEDLPGVIDAPKDFSAYVEQEVRRTNAIESLPR